MEGAFGLEPELRVRSEIGPVGDPDDAFAYAGDGEGGGGAGTAGFYLVGQGAHAVFAFLLLVYVEGRGEEAAAGDVVDPSLLVAQGGVGLEREPGVVYGEGDDDEASLGELSDRHVLLDGGADPFSGDDDRGVFLDFGSGMEVFPSPYHFVF